MFKNLGWVGTSIRNDNVTPCISVLQPRISDCLDFIHPASPECSIALKQDREALVMINHNYNWLTVSASACCRKTWVKVSAQTAQRLFDTRGIKTRPSGCIILNCLYLSEMVYSTRLYFKYHDYMFRNIHYSHRTKMESISTMVCFQNEKLKSNVNVKIMPIGFYKDFFTVFEQTVEYVVHYFCSIIRKRFICMYICAWWVVGAATVCCVKLWLFTLTEANVSS